MLEIDWRPDSRRLRWFAALQLLFCGGMAWLWREALGPNGQGVLLAVSAVVATAGLLAPQVIRPVYVAWMAIVFPIGWVVSHAMLAIVYFGVLTPIALLVRRRRGDPLRRKVDPETDSYWDQRASATSIDRYFRQF